MNDFIVEINEPIPNLLSIETSFADNVVNNIEIQFIDTVNVDIVNTEKVLVSDLPDNIPFSKIAGNLDSNRIDNLDSFVSGYLNNDFIINANQIIWENVQVGLSGYLNQYTFDGGEP